MIVLHDYQLIFLKAAKVAGTSFEIALSRYAHERDIITPIVPKDEEIRAKLNFRGPQNYEHSIFSLIRNPSRRSVHQLMRGRWPALYWNHIDAARTKAQLGKSTWDRYLKVAIVRDPWDRLVSRYFFNNPGAKCCLDNFTSWAFSNSTLLEENYAQYMIEGEVIIDLFIRFERFQEDIERLELIRDSLSGLFQTFSTIRAKSNFRPKKEIAVRDIFHSAPAVDKLVREKNAFEIEKFGYDIEEDNA